MRAAQLRMPGFARKVFSWTLFAWPARVVTGVLAVEAITVVLTVLLAAHASVAGSDLVVFGVLAGLGLLASETTQYLERMRRQLTNTPHVNMSSVWILPVTLLASPLLGAVTSVLLYTHLWWRSSRNVPVHRAVFNTCVSILCAYATAAIENALSPHGFLEITGPAQLVPLIVVIVAYWTVNSALVAGVIALTERQRSVTGLFGNRGDNALEAIMLCTGVLIAVLMDLRPWLIVLVVPTVYVLVKGFEEAAMTDRKTGLLDAASWHALAAHAFGKARHFGTPVAVLMLDLDNFKCVNDSRGHLAGDEVLRVVAGMLRRRVRTYDLAGRFGGEEFVVFLPATEVETAVEIAERLCVAVRELRFEAEASGGALAGLRLSVSIGVAGYPGAGADLDELLLAADNAMFAAKQGGRDRVCVVRRPAGRGLPRAS